MLCTHFQVWDPVIRPCADLASRQLLFVVIVITGTRFRYSLIGGMPGRRAHVLLRELSYVQELSGADKFIILTGLAICV